MGDRDELDDDMILKAIQHACVAGGCRFHARKNQGAARGLVKAADKHSADATALLNSWMTRHLAVAGRSAFGGE